MDIKLIDKVKRIVITALASDDSLMETLILKGGNAIDLLCNLNSNSNKISRTSYDLDYSIEDNDFKEDLKDVAKRIEEVLSQFFLENDLMLFDFKFEIKPKVSRNELASFWGGYKVLFKVIHKELYDRNPKNIDKLRRESVKVNSDSSPVFILEFSKFEFIGQKQSVNVDGYNIYVYAPAMIVFEKLRAICQQLPQYGDVIPSFSPRARARDFYDIHLMMNLFDIKPSTIENIELIKNVFEAKKVPTSFIKEIKNNKSLHLDNWKSVQDTVPLEEKSKLKSFDFYFDFVLTNFESITFP